MREKKTKNEIQVEKASQTIEERKGNPKIIERSVEKRNQVNPRKIE